MAWRKLLRWADYSWRWAILAAIVWWFVSGWSFHCDVLDDQWKIWGGSPYVHDGADTRVSPDGVKRPSLPAYTLVCGITYYELSPWDPKFDSDHYESRNWEEVDFDDSGRVERINYKNGGWLENRTGDRNGILTDEGYYAVDGLGGCERIGSGP